MTASAPDTHIAAQMAEYTCSPLDFVYDCFPWGEPGPLANQTGPDDWQCEFLLAVGAKAKKNNFNGHDSVSPIQMAVASGHGIGKSALFAWLHWWIMCTRPEAKVRVTANTADQLSLTTWAEIQKWHDLLICKDMFGITESGAWHKENPTQWWSAPVNSVEERSEAFAGQHNVHSTSAYLFDESSLIPDKIFEVAQYGCTDGEAMWFVFGNPTRNTGMFYEICFGEEQWRWDVRSIDARTCKIPNKEEQQKEIERYGIDSDRVRTRILGMPPRQAEDQLIGKDLVDGARARIIEPMEEDPLIAGVDIPDGGSGYFVVRFRRGLSARPGALVPEPFRLTGSRCDRAMMVATLGKMLGKKGHADRISMMFVDSQPGAVIVERLRNLGYLNVQEVSFGGKSDDPLYANMRAVMWGKEMRDWLAKGSIDPEDAILRKQLSYPGFHYRVGGDGALLLESKEEMKKRKLESPDDADALALTFAYPVIAATQPLEDYRPPRNKAGSGDNWMLR